MTRRRLPPAARSGSLVPGRLQRACACGRHTNVEGCAACRPGGAAQARPAIVDRELVAQAWREVAAEPPDGEVTGLPDDAGAPLDATTRAPMEVAFGRDLEQVRVHTSSTAQMTAARLGARAFAHRGHIWLGPGERATDRPLLAHEVAHLVQQRPGGQMISLRPATDLERRAWLGFFDHYLPRKLLNNYMDDTGAAVTLTQQEMADCNPVVDLRRSQQFNAEVTRLRSAGGGTATINVSGWGGALTNGTLGNFTIRYRGVLRVTAKGEWTFTGTMEFYDFWNFDPKPFGGGSGRPLPAEIKVRVAAMFIPGKPFHVRSVAAPVTQSSTDSRAGWAGGVPVPKPDQGVRAGADIEVGAGGGEAAGVPGVEVGTEVGAQSAEDLNR